MKNTKTPNVRLIGLLYVLVIICAGFSQGYVRGTIITPGDASMTASNILDNLFLFRVGLASDLIAFILDAVISVLLYQWLKPYGKTLAMISSSLRLLAHPAIGSLNLLNHFMAYHVLSSGSMATEFSPEQLESLSLFFTEAHQYGYLIAGGFFGLHCFLLGYVLIKSKAISTIFGWLMLLAAVGYLTESFGDFLLPGNEESLAILVGVSAALGEVLLAFYLLIRGSKLTPNTERIRS